jgi:hypothetical protein
MSSGGLGVVVMLVLGSDIKTLPLEYLRVECLTI